MKRWVLGSSASRQRRETEPASTDVDFRLHSVEGFDGAKMLQDVATAQTEPFGDFSIFPTLLVSQAARTELTATLSGDGGDELFWGYERPLSLLRNGRDFRWPYAIRYGLYAAGKVGLIGRRSGAVAAKSVGDYYFGVNSRSPKQRLLAWFSDCTYQQALFRLRPPCPSSLS